LTAADVGGYNKSFLRKRVPAYLEESSLIFLAFVVPLAVYCLVLSVINRRRHPVIVAGSWDFAGVLFAASGFLLLGGPAILTGLYEQWRLAWLLGQIRYLQGIGENWSFWITLWLLYFAVVGSVSAFVLWRRRTQTSIYNIEPAVFGEVLTQVLDRLGLQWQHNGPRRLLLRFREPSLGDSGALMASLPVRHRSEAAGPSALAGPYTLHPAVTAQGPSTSAYPWCVLTVEPFPVMRHVTLDWLSHDETIRPEVEAELAKALTQVPTPENPVAGWFLALSLLLFFSAFLALLALLAIRILQFPR
jgi:hypothetical protein